MIDFIQEVRWDRLGAFTFSNEEDTPAYTMEGQISQEIMDERLERLMTVQNQIAQENGEALIGKTLEVLIENQDGLTGYYHGRGIHSAPDGIDGLIKFKSSRSYQPGTFAWVKVTKARHHDLIGVDACDAEEVTA